MITKSGRGNYITKFTMKIKELRISNVLSFRYFDSIEDAPSIIFDDNLNIFIGENGAGKSTALEVINFIFKRVLFTQFNINQDLYSRKNNITLPEKKQIITPVNNWSYSGFRLEPNWDTESSNQRIQFKIELDEIDELNINNLIVNIKKVNSITWWYTNHSTPITPTTPINKNYTINIVLNKDTKLFSAENVHSTDFGYQYLENYNFYKELIGIYNLENPQNQIAWLYESFSLIGSYRNYHAFTSSVSLQGSTAMQQIQQINTQEYSKSLNANDQSEPTIFNMVRLRIAGKQYDLFDSTTKELSEESANSEQFLSNINAKLRLVNLEVKIELLDKRNWSYSFQFFDTKRNKPLNDINSLSAGQKAIIHLVFEAYGRGDLKWWLVIIDEPEIHLHYQFQNEYLKIIEDINREQKCQYILVTHSESLINSSTIHNVKRFALDWENHTAIKSPSLSEEQKLLVKILDNTRSTHAFFGKKILLVEGETDRYFFKSMLKEYKPDFEYQISVLDINGKWSHEKWKSFFESFWLIVYYVGDLDNIFHFCYTTEPAYKLKWSWIISGFKCTHTDIISKIEEQYANNVFILKNWDLEEYLKIDKKWINETINFCNERLSWYLNETWEEITELKVILDKITQ